MARRRPASGGARVVYGAADELDRSAFSLWREPWVRLGGSRAGCVDPAWARTTSGGMFSPGSRKRCSAPRPWCWCSRICTGPIRCRSWVLARLAPGLVGDAVGDRGHEPAGWRRRAWSQLVRPDRGAALARSRPRPRSRSWRTRSHRTRSSMPPHCSRETGGNPLFVRELVRSPAAGVTGVVGLGARAFAQAAQDRASRTVLAALSSFGSRHAGCCAGRRARGDPDERFRQPRSTTESLAMCSFAGRWVSSSSATRLLAAPRLSSIDNRRPPRASRATRPTRGLAAVLRTRTVRSGAPSRCRRARSSTA